MSDTPIKPGYKTTEFWLTIAANVVGVLMMANIFPIDSTVGKIIGVAAMVLSSLGYTVSRSIAKK